MNDQARLFQINISPGGVPKLSQHAADVTLLGLTGDLHNDTEHHGGPEKAICLYSLEVLQTLQGEGHPIFPGSTGENLTISGLDWSLVVAGLRLAIGDTVVIEVTRYATPCHTIRDSFIDQQFNRISWRINPGWARAYARVLAPGRIATGDTVRIAK